MVPVQNKVLLSILVPIYNWDISTLLKYLVCNIKDKYEECVELILADDCSTNLAIRDNNKKNIAHSDHSVTIKYFELSKNVGRSKVRNILVEKSAGCFILFLDADVLPDHDCFIEVYLKHIFENTCDVVCGGLSYKTRYMNDPKNDFYVYLSSKNDVLPAQKRNIVAWRHLLTSNIMIRKSAFLATPFNIAFVGYGYEDSEWGLRLAEKYKVRHIDNTVSHLGLINKRQVYKRMRESIKNYVLLASLHPDKLHESNICKYVQWFRLCNIELLRLVDKTLEFLYFASCFHRISYVTYQLNKAVLFAIEVKYSGISNI